MSAPRNWRKWLVLLLGLALSAQPIGCDYSPITEKFGAEAVARCNEKCPFQNRTGDGHFDLSCGSDCSTHQCKIGCSLWKQGLENSCQTSCNVTSETAVSRELYCVMGCNEALNTYFQKLRELIGTPPPPALVADSLTPTSLSLVWEAPNLGNLSYLVQWRYEELPGTWQFYSNDSHADRSIIDVWDLRPYTKYRFRVAIFLAGRGGSGEPVHSDPSVVISTLEHGKPGSPPSALRAAAPDPSRVAISWEPGPFPNGPLIGYVLKLADTQPNAYTALEDMPASNNTFFYMFQNLVPAREYQVSVSMRNAEGEGPTASVKVSTPHLPASIPQQSVLILGGEQNIVAAPANDMLSDPVELYSTRDLITGVGLDISSDYLFVSVSNGYVHRSSLSKKSKSVPILTPDSTSYKPHDLSVDWLNRHLYVLGEVYYNKAGSASNSTLYSNWEILRCDFDGNNQLVALSGFTSRPVHFEVDPYNGYLFFALRGADAGGGGLYRLDLANISNGVRRDSPPELIVRDAHLGAFTVDHADFRLLVAHLLRNNILAVSLDGREVTDFRSNTQSPKFISARSIAYANGLFYWTNGNEMLTEEYHAQSDSYFHNEYPLVFNTAKIVPKQVLVNLRSCQPIPVPVNPPIGVQSVMGIDKAKVAWSPPHLLGHQGSGAWQRWRFHLHLSCSETGEVIERRDINGSSYTVENLKQNSEYVVKVAAVTASGSGPWSSEFRGKTLELSPTTLQSTLLWSGPDGLLQTDLTGENLQTLIHRSRLKELYISDISWYRDKLYLVTNASTVIWYNTTSHENGLMLNMDNVGSMAVDWVGKKIYWSNPKQQLITRGNLDGGNREPVPIVTVAKELTIDSLNAYIYWNTGHAVEAARLNGENKMVYYPAQLFSGKQVMGLTTDLEQKWLYWLVRSYDGSELHRAPTADRFTHGLEVSDSLVTRLSGTATLGPLCYFSHRLVWVQDSARAVVSDLQGRYTAHLLPRVRVIAVRDPTLHAASESLIAIPETINASSIEVRGTWERFNVSWAPARRVNVNNTRIYYDVSLLVPPSFKIERTVEVPWLQVQVSSVPPHSAMEVTVRAHSHWGGGAAARAPARSPQAAPSAPPRPRLYVQPAGSGGYLTAIFRWEAPVHSNGVIRGYETQCWLLPDGTKPSASTRPSACADATLPPTHTQLMLRDLVPAATYFFQVRASTDAGYGPYSDIVSASSGDVNPIPKVMTSSQESIKIIDLDSGDSVTIPKSTGIPVDLAVSIEENIVYWVNNMEEIFSSRINGSGHNKLTSINGSATSMCFDWVSRSVYWSQLEISSDSHVVYRADLGLANTRPSLTRLFAANKTIYSLQVVPSQRSLYWHEESNSLGLGNLVTSKIDGTELRAFFNSSVRMEAEKPCNCPENPQTARSFVIDLTKEQYEVYWIDPWTNQIIATDMTGCYCRVVLDATEKKKYGFVPTSLTIDSKYVYWFNSTERAVYYTTKNTKSRIEQMKASYAYKILALDPGNQPYPPRQCLFPRSENLKAIIKSNTANSITLQLPQINKPEQCLGLEYEMTSTEYTVYYRLHTSNDETLCSKESCPFITTTEKEVLISDLKPFTNYTVMLEAVNYYSKLHEIKPVSGQPLVLQTAAEAPTAAKDVTATVLSPVLARVEWTPEPGLWYELHWRTDNSASPPHKFKEHNTWEVSEGRAANMTRLSAGTAYSVWVRARSNHSAAHADSAALRVRTFPTPPPPRPAPAAATPYELRVLWAPPAAYRLHQYSVEYALASAGSSEWRACDRNARDEWVARGLRPRTRYRFRLRLQYAPRAPPYYWPHDDHVTAETDGDAPGPPGAVRAEAVGERVLRAWWAEPEPRGAPVERYRVWGRPAHRTNHLHDNVTMKNVSEMLPKDLPSDIDDELKMRIVREGLELLHNGTENYWLIGSGEVSGRYVVWVQARNAFGWGGVSAAGELDASRLARAAPAHRAAALVAAAAALAALALAVAAPALYMYNNRGKKKAPPESNLGVTPTRRNPDVELAILRQLPTRHSTNIIYNQGDHPPTDVELAALSHIRREQITLTKFLGSGAFGEVFEGVARGLNGASTDTKVAVKTLRKGATDQEKTEFLQEAALMSNFKHEHILRLLGVCLDNDPNYIIMELMEGGDLLSYLRAKRSSLYTPESLTLLDLLNMCVDVTKGCRYLEEMHFVHRDLACRNCLVAHRGDGRVVKIGDFGLARDIYKNDYYRKEGEGLLPVRWMAVECLVDGVFSCQSDVWAWAVLCWEVLSLGQQPYPARTNRQVLAYVRAGGSPSAPPNCPAHLYELLQKCWSYAPEARPSFKQCLEVITALRDKTSPNITLTATANAPQYLTLLGDDESFPEHRIEPSLLYPRRAPKYLELMYDSDSNPGTVCDGYEMPRTPFVSRGFMPTSRHSIIGVAPNRLIKPPLYRTHSLRTNMRPPNATIIPLRNGIVKRASLCESLHGTYEPQASTSVTSALDEDVDQNHVFKTPF